MSSFLLSIRSPCKGFVICCENVLSFLVFRRKPRRSCPQSILRQ
ncbi:unnamed protein product [Nippostrongylus brasiliensis]|uniref:Uncharacterized protein n=1 Tax=Nippostrongylus brasiliensis TaxID=27835 RepID=A0A0N4XEG0_NIPBR|nr:unnamed protein product [Nippostrongylus brasiliensis]